MSEINTLTVNGKTYELADATARNQAGELNSHIEGVLYSKNLIPFDYTGGNYSKHGGITYQKQEDGSIIANGTATNTSRYIIMDNVPIQAGTYTLSGIPAGETSGRQFMYRIGESGSWVSSFRSGTRTITLESDSTLSLRIQYNSGYVTDNQLWKPMLEKGDTAHDFASPNTTLHQMKKNRTVVTYNFADHIVKGIAHGGYTAEAPENTIAAFKLAKQRGLSFVECDTAVTADGVVVLLHDKTVDRTSNGSGSIAEMTFEEARALDFSYSEGAYNETYPGEKIPSFEEFILYCRNAKLYPYIEIKSTIAYSDEKLQEMVDIVNRYGMAKSCSWTSFSIDYLEKLVAIDPNIRAGFIIDSAWTEGLTTNAAIYQALNLRTGTNEVFIAAKFNSLTTEGIEACKAFNLPIEVYTLYTEAEFANVDSYISGVISNRGNYEAYLLEVSTT